MPHLRFRAVSVDTLKQISSPCWRISVPSPGQTGVRHPGEHRQPLGARGEVEAGFPFVELVWFERPQELQDAAAALITRHLKAVLGEQTYVVVQVLPIVKSGYYSNGQHY